MSDASLSGITVQIGDQSPITVRFIARGAANGPMLAIGLGIAAVGAVAAAAILSGSSCRDAVAPGARKNRSGARRW